LEQKIEQLEKEIKEYSSAITATKPNRLPDNVSESYLLKESALQVILKLTALEEVSSLTKTEQLED
jgi:hypothetical protein